MGSLPQFPQYDIEIMLFPYLLLMAVKKMNKLIITRKVVCKHRELCYYYVTITRIVKSSCAIDLGNVMKEIFMIFSLICFSL